MLRAAVIDASVARLRKMSPVEVLLQKDATGTLLVSTYLL